MLIDTIQLAAGSSIVNATIASGTVFPNDPNPGELFFRTDLDLMHVYNNNAWVELGGGGGSAAAVTNSFFPGTLEPTTGTLRWYPGKAVTLTSLFLSVSTTSATPIIIDVKKSGVSFFQGEKPRIAAGSNTSAIIPLAISMSENDYITVDIISTGGSDLTVRFEYE